MFGLFSFKINTAQRNSGAGGTNPSQEPAEGRGYRTDMVGGLPVGARVFRPSIR